MKELNTFKLPGSKDEQITKYCNTIIAVNTNADTETNKCLKSVIQQGAWFNKRIPKNAKYIVAYALIEDWSNIHLFANICRFVLSKGGLIIFNIDELPQKAMDYVASISSSYDTHPIVNGVVLYNKSITDLKKYL